MDEDAFVRVDPGRQFGSPCINGTRIPTEVAANFARMGLLEAEFVDGYDVTMRQALVACWYEAVHGRRRWFRTHWKQWAEDAHLLLWHKAGELPAPPPSEAEVKAAA